jgi:hypothetical protein
MLMSFRIFSTSFTVYGGERGEEEGKRKECGGRGRGDRGKEERRGKRGGRREKRQGEG